MKTDVKCCWVLAYTGVKGWNSRSVGKIINDIEFKVFEKTKLDQ